MSQPIQALEITAPRTVAHVEDTLGDPKPGEVQVTLAYGGISAGTEMNVYRGVAPMWSTVMDPETRLFVNQDKPQWSYPMRYGYMATGHIAKIGKDVTDLQEGDAVYAYASPQTAINLPRGRVVKLPDHADLETAVLLANLNTTFNAHLDADLHIGETVVVFGLGVLGQLLVQWARRGGAGTIVGIDLLESRRTMAETTSGAIHTLDPSAHEDLGQALRAITGPGGADVTFEVSGSDRALNEAIRSVGIDGKVMVLSWYPETWQHVIPSREFHHNRVRLICSQVGAIRPELSHRWTLERRTGVVLDQMCHLTLKPLATHRFAFADAADAYATVDQGDPHLMLATLKY